MCCAGFWKRIVPFILSLTLGSAAVSFLQKNSLSVNQKTVKVAGKVNYSKQGMGQSGSDSGQYHGNEIVPNVKGKPSQYTRAEKKSLEIISKPRPNYTDAARQNQTQGKITLLVVFLADGQIGNVTPVGGLPDGLPEQALEAAKNIKFTPAATNDGRAYSIVIPVQYTFNLY